MYRTNDISIKAQLAFALGTACVVAIVIAALAEYGMYATNLSLQSVYEQDLVALRILSRLENRTLETGALAASLAIDTDHGTVADDIHLLEQDLDDFDLSWKEYSENQLHSGTSMQALNAAFRTAFDQMREQGLRPIIAAARANDFATANALAHRNLPALRANLRQTLLALKNAQVDNGKASYDASRARAAWLSTGLLAFAALGLAFAIVCAIWILLRLYRQLGGEPAYAVGIARKIADGDLTAEVTLRIGDTASLLAAMKKMRDALAHTVAHIRDSAHGVSAASRQIAGGNIDLSQRTEEQAASLEQTASSMEQLTATVKQNADSAQTAMTLAVAASNVTQRGGTVVAQTAQTMLDIHQESHKMVDIIAAIEGIAFQTNILALNAAVEAARAGESGRGFAVVASEVRLLAQRSATAAKEIRALIQSSVNKITNGTTLAGEAGNLMSEVQESAQRVVHIIHEIADASREQSSGIEQISLAVAQIDNITQQNAALVEEAAAATHALEQQAAQLTAAVDVFRIEAQREKDAHAPALPVGSARTGPRTATLRAANRARGVITAG